MAEKNRPLIVFRYLWENTDEEHPAIIKDILSYLEEKGIHSDRKTVAADLVELQKSGFDIICNKSRQNQYFIGDRGFELAELKTIVDAVQAAQFISSSKSKALIEKLTKLSSPYQSDQLKRNLYVDGKVKTTNESVYYTVDLLHHAIQTKSVVSFQYVEYTPKKEKILKHKGQRYYLSPYDLVWNNDAYYIFGWSEKNNHNKVVKFRVDRIVHPREIKRMFHDKPEEYSIERFCKRVFSVYDGNDHKVNLLCENCVMKDVIDRFGEAVTTKVIDDYSFIAEVDVSVSQTFFAWVFVYAGKIKIIGPEKVKRAFNEQIKVFMT